MNCEEEATFDSGNYVHTNPMPHLKELMEVNKLWKRDYDLLQKKYEQEKGQLQEDNHKLKQEVRRSELRCSKLETKNLTLQSELVRLAKAFELLHPNCSNVHSKERMKETADVELIREQLDVYKEDFKLEHQDKEKIQSEKASLQERLSQCEKIVQGLNKELEAYKKECTRLHDEKGTLRWNQKHPSIDRSHSYPSTSSTAHTEVPVSPVSTIAMPPSLDRRRDGYLSLEDFRHEQFKRGILVRNPSQTRPPPGNVRPTPRRLSDSSSPSPRNRSLNDCHSSRTSCLW